MSLSKGISAFATKATIQASKSVNNRVEEYFTKHVDLSPIKPFGQFATGHLKNNWYVVIGTSAILSSDSVANPSGIDSLSRIKALLAQNPFWGKDNTVTLSNSVSYAYRADKLGWEAGGGANGWVWSGRVGPYMMSSLSKQYIKGKYA